jgi:hypothetical protein
MFRRLSALALPAAGVAVAASRPSEGLMFSVAAILSLIAALGVLTVIAAVLFASSSEPVQRLIKLLKAMRAPQPKWRGTPTSTSSANSVTPADRHVTEFNEQDNE